MFFEETVHLSTLCISCSIVVHLHLLTATGSSKSLKCFEICPFLLSVVGGLLELIVAALLIVVVALLSTVENLPSPLYDEDLLVLPPLLISLTIFLVKLRKQRIKENIKLQQLNKNLRQQ
ncbi:hypothetical protein V6Z12_D07G080600 [Gossypium hirsutum]